MDANTLYQVIQAGAYNNTVPYPSKNDYMKFYVYSKGKVIVDGRPVPWDHDECDALRAGWEEKGYTIEQPTDHEAMDKARSAYQAGEVAMISKFRKDIEQVFGMTGHPKADLLYSKSYERGHSGGFSDVFNIYQDLIELVK